MAATAEPVLWEFPGRQKSIYDVLDAKWDQYYYHQRFACHRFPLKATKLSVSPNTLRVREQ